MHVIKRLFPKSSFAKNVLTLITGTTLAQLIPIAISPILTRLYTPEDFGIFALYLSLATILAVAITGRYELAITIPKRDNNAANITALAIGLSCITSVILLVLVIFFNKQIAGLLNAPAIATWLYFLPLSTFLLGIYQSLNYWSNRKSQYKRMALSRMTQSGFSAGSQLGTGFVSATAGGLIGGQIVGQVASSFVLGRLIFSENKKQLLSLSRTRMSAMARKYSAFPKYLILAHGFNTASSQMPIILLGALFSSTIAGFFMLTQRVIAAPISIIASAIGDVFRQEASYAYAHQGNCRKEYLKALKRLTVIAVIPFIIFYIYAPELFILAFGKEWKTAGEYAQILTPMFCLRFITSPLSSMFLIAEKQRLDLAWQVILFSLVIGSFTYGYFNNDVTKTITAFSASYCFMYAINGIISFKLTIKK